MRFMNTKVAEGICDTVGVVQKSSKAVDDEGGYFIRVRVSINITFPLCRGRVITLENGEKHWVNFNYERLPNFCFWCGRLNYSDKNCNLWIESKGTLSLDSQQFNSSLKVAPYSAGGKNVIYVLGFYERRQPYANLEPCDSTHNPILVKETQPVTVTEIGVEGNKGGEVADMVMEASDEGNKGDKLSELILDLELFPIKDSISNGLLPIKALIILEKEVNEEPLNSKAVDSAKLFEIEINEIDEILNNSGQTSVFKGNSMILIHDDNYSHANPKRPIMGNTLHKLEISEPHIVQATVPYVATSSAPNRPSTKGKRNKQIRTKAVGIKEQSKLIGGKRSGDDHLELPRKRRLVSKGDENFSNSIVEVETQPRQSQ